jgi:hypothetical protein
MYPLFPFPSARPRPYWSLRPVILPFAKSPAHTLLLEYSSTSLKFETDLIAKLDKRFFEWVWMSFVGPSAVILLYGPMRNPYLSLASISSVNEPMISFEGFSEGAEGVGLLHRRVGQR